MEKSSVLFHAKV